MLIYATCKCCTERNKIVKNYDTEKIFKQTLEFRTRLLASLLEHLRDIEKVCRSQGHYDKIWIKLDKFTNEERISVQILNEFLPEKELKKIRKAEEEKNKTKAKKKPSSDSKDEKEPKLEEILEF